LLGIRAAVAPYWEKWSRISKEGERRREQRGEEEEEAREGQLRRRSSRPSARSLSSPAPKGATTRHRRSRHGAQVFLNSSLKLAEKPAGKLASSLSLHLPSHLPSSSPPTTQNRSRLTVLSESVSEICAVEGGRRRVGGPVVRSSILSE
jgi:hypothetical protein